MSRPMIRIHDTETNEIIDREMTKAEFDEYLVYVEQSEKQAAERDAKDAARSTLLEKLGLSEDEARALLG